MKPIVALALLSVAACGGLIAPDPDGGAAAGPVDAGPKGDATILPPTQDANPTPPVVCSPHSNSGFAGANGQCGTQSDWSCGADKFEVVCSCPEAKCKCIQNGVLQATVNFPSCPSCSGVTPTALCPFPQ